VPAAPPPRPKSRPRSASNRPRVSALRAWLAQGDRRTRWIKLASLVFGVPAAIGFVAAVILWIVFARMIDSRLGGDQKPVPRIYGRPFELRVGEGLSPIQLEQRLNDVGYAKRAAPELPGQFAVTDNAILLIPRTTGKDTPRTVRVDFSRSSSPIITRLIALSPAGATPPPPPPKAPAPKATKGGKAKAVAPRPPAGTPLDRLALETPLLAAFAPGEKRRYTPIASIPRAMIDAVLAIEDRRFFAHPGVDPIGAFGALLRNLKGDKPYLAGGSTITQQIVKNEFLTSAKFYRRKLQEQFMALVLESRFTKSQILELYLNEVVLGQRGPFEIHGVAEGARIFFGKDVSNLTLAEAATLAGIIQSPSRLSPFRHVPQATERRNVVLRAMADAGFISVEASKRAMTEPLKVFPRSLENEAPFFVDYVSSLVDEKYSGLLQQNTAVDVYTTLDLQLQRLAQEAVAEGIALVDKQLAARKRKGPAEAALIAADPRTGEILAFVGGRAYNQSQFDRAIAAHRQPGSVFKPFVYLAAFERMAEEGRGDLTPATLMVDEPTTFKDGQGNDYNPANYQGEYGGQVTLRDALAHSRNIISIKVAEQTGFDRVAALWKKVGVGAEAKPYPSIALGVFEATPIDIATAYTVFPNQGAIRPLYAVSKIVQDGKTRQLPPPAARQIARPETTYLVLNMMRSVLNEGTAAGARSAGFVLDAAGKTGTTNDLRDAWFAGFTPELLTVVWVGLDSNQPIGLSGSQAALPIWTAFMKRALSARANKAFAVPDKVTFADVDKETGKLATPGCPSVTREAFLPGTEPRDHCDLHGSAGDAVKGFFSKLGRIFGKG
jgi:penicillin-binding protein 1B